MPKPFRKHADASYSTESLAGIVSTAANRVESFLGQYPFLTLAIFTAAYIPYVIARALLKPLWFDELATLFVARMDSIAKIVTVLSAGVDAQPPLSFFLVHWSTRLPIGELISARIPSMFGFWLMSVCVYLFAARRGPRIWAILALLFPFTTGLFFYATEARPYGLVLGFSALALLAWQSAPNSRYRPLWLIALFLSLAATICTHYYGVLVPIALGAGELARWWRRRAIGWEMAAIAASYGVLAWLRPILSAQTSRLGVHWAKPKFAYVLEFYNSSLEPALLPIALLVLAVGAYEMIRRKPATLSQDNLPVEELVAALAFLLIPLSAYAVAVLVTHTYTGRYSIASLLGMSLLFCWGVRHFTGDRTGSALVAVLVLCALLGPEELRTLRTARHYKLNADLQDEYPFPFNGDLPIVVQDGRDFLKMARYAPPELARRLFYLADPEQSLRLEGSLGLDVSLLDLKNWFPLQVEQYRSFVMHHDRFLLFWGKPAKESLIGWQMTKLLEDGARLEVAKQRGQRVLFTVDLRGKAPPSFSDNVQRVP